MRIIAGKAKGFRLKTPKGLDVRPTADRVKESIFNILRDQIPDASVLDLFGGTGNLGLESVSRGAEQVLFFDTSPKSIAIIRDNIAQTHFEAACTVRKMNALQGIRSLRSERKMFDVIFGDPPYNRGWVKKVLSELDVPDTILATSGVFILEHSAHEEPPTSLNYLQITRKEKFGETQITFITKK